MKFDLNSILQEELDTLDSKHLRRRLRNLSPAQGAEIYFDGRPLLNFASNDYLGLACEEFLKESAASAVRDFGAGSGSARLISGTLPPHTELEETLADFKRTQAALAFSCGFSTAVGTIPAIVGKRDVVILDKLSHACLVDGARLSGATLRVFPHNDCSRLESHLRWARTKFPHARILIVTESVFSMDGDLAPLLQIVELKEKFGAWLLVDEAHGVGVLGAQGRGLVDHLGLCGQVEVQMGTLGKALGAAGGYIAGSRALVDLLVNRARSFIFSTAPPPSQAAAACAALRWLLTDEGSERVQRLGNLRSHWNFLQTQAMQSSASASAIVPVHVGAEDLALQLAAWLWEQGFFVPAIRYPVVARGQARLRVTLTAAHSQDQLSRLWLAVAASFSIPPDLGNPR
jgi:8-amino-7-oxononanoate synthase